MKPLVSANTHLMGLKTPYGVIGHNECHDNSLVYLFCCYCIFVISLPNNNNKMRQGLECITRLTDKQQHNMTRFWDPNYIAEKFSLFVNWSVEFFFIFYVYDII